MLADDHICTSNQSQYLALQMSADSVCVCVWVCVCVCVCVCVHACARVHAGMQMCVVVEVVIGTREGNIGLYVHRNH